VATKRYFDGQAELRAGTHDENPRKTASHLQSSPVYLFKGVDLLLRRISRCGSAGREKEQFKPSTKEGVLINEKWP
jgi:hypothetical protein